VCELLVSSWRTLPASGHTSRGSASHATGQPYLSNAQVSSEHACHRLCWGVLAELVPGAHILLEVSLRVWAAEEQEPDSVWNDDV
jgi:hypothetical protein